MVLYCDGASRGNPGPAAYGFLILENEAVVAQGGERLGVATNNIAEYQGLLNGLKRCIELAPTQLTVRSDSELMVRQLLGRYKVRAPQLLPLYQEAKKLLSHFPKVAIEHVRREENTLADALANKALDEL